VLAAGWVHDASADSPGAHESALGEPIVTPVELTLLAWVTYRGVRPFHHDASPDNHPCEAGGCRFPSYVGDDMS